MSKMEEEIRGSWFKNHVATLSKHGDLEVLDWQQPGTVIFKVRYVFDGCHMYVSGDLGEAVFRFTEKANPTRVSRYDLHYFEEKLRAFCDARRDFDRDKAKGYLVEQKNEGIIDESVYSELLSLVDQCSTSREWEHLIYDDVNRFGEDAWEWLPGIGQFEY